MTDDDILGATGSDFCFPYRELPIQATVSQLNAYCGTTRKLFAPIAKKFSAEDNSRWILRHYLAIKFVAAASLLAGSAAYAFDHNLLLGVPYFNYYAALNACRAFLLTSPHVSWDGTKTIEMTHENILNRTAEYMRALDPDRRITWRNRLAELREQRELFSYRFPLSGPDLVGREAFDPEVTAELVSLIAELASLNTECLQGALKKHSSEDIPVHPLADHDWATVYALAGEKASDPRDRERFGKLVRGWRTVSTLQVMTSDGLKDDLYGSWADLDDGSGFNPDKCSRLILAL